ncbi:uncharacterized protein LOC129887436 [Solanum dulcamara]|uniref:uncharacterized protein LOC129887429 n=1 Tax=Solanum dulcamara TaxID=45834 RepID=UPI0024863F05|nr:uncharacterized protein LOC129887429 [Solanum dulcamara]XP_055818517.1 uncharacterized protein LOC129887436 [Solanum dulcamara]
MEKYNTQDFSSITCEIQIIKGRNIDQSSLGKSNLFVRCYLPAGNNQKVKLNSQEISSKSDLFWDESFSLNCMGNQDSINMMKQGTVVFELRSRKYLPLLGKNISGSQLLGRVEIPWKRVFESTEMEIEEWAIFMATSKNINKDVKPPAVKIAMKVKVNETTKINKLRRPWDESCACKGYCGCNSNSIFSADAYEIFALGASLDAF